MGLKADLLDAILQASADAGVEEPPDLSDGTFSEISSLSNGSDS